MPHETHYSDPLLELDDHPAIVLVAYARRCPVGLYAIASELLEMLSPLSELKLRRVRFTALAGKGNAASKMLVDAGWKAEPAFLENVPVLHDLILTGSHLDLSQASRLESAWRSSPPESYGVQLQWKTLREGSFPLCEISSRHDGGREGVAQILLIVPIAACSHEASAVRRDLVDRFFREIAVRFGTDYGFIDVCGRNEAGGGHVHYGDRMIPTIGWSRFCDRILWQRVRNQGLLKPVRPYWGNFFGRELLSEINADDVVRTFEALIPQALADDWGRAERIADDNLAITLSADPIHGAGVVRSTVQDVLRSTIPFIADLLPRM